jgi:hypothetical protein
VFVFVISKVSATGMQSTERIPLAANDVVCAVLLINAFCTAAFAA